MERGEAGLRLELDWKERGGPPLKRARRTGFGTRLIGMVIERQLGGSVTRTFGSKGMEAKLSCRSVMRVAGGGGGCRCGRR